MCKKPSITAVLTQGLAPDSPARLIRTEVFMEEQGFENEFDAIDSIAWHVVVAVDAEPAATGRTFPAEKPGSYVLGRICVRKGLRKHHLGAQVIAALEEKIRQLGGQRAELSAQCQARGFYEKLGYQAQGPEYLDEHCAHVHMEKAL